MRLQLKRQVGVAGWAGSGCPAGFASVIKKLLTLAV
jgi:hypothetical protein